MKPVYHCAICNASLSEDEDSYQCEVCGRRICGDHAKHDGLRHLCEECAEEAEAENEVKASAA